MSKVRIKKINNTKKATIQPEVSEAVASGSRLYIDARSSFYRKKRYNLEAVDHAEEYGRGAVHTNGLENFWSLLKRCINGTYVSVEAEHLGAYLDEQAFRFNERKRNDQERFYLTSMGSSGRRLTYKELIARPEGTPPCRGGQNEGMKLPNSDEFAHLSDAERFKAVMKRLVSVTPEQLAAAERQCAEEKAEAKLPESKGKPRKSKS